MRVLSAGTMVFTLLICSQAEAGWIKDRLNDAKKIVHDVPKAVLPVQPVIDVVRGKKDPGEAVREVMQAQGQALGTVIDTTRTLTTSADQAFGQLAQATGGDFGRIVYELSTGSERLVREFAFTAGSSASAVLQGRDPLIALAMPLAAAIRDARSKFIGQAAPLPEDLVRLLAPTVPEAILRRVRYTRGDIKISLPSVINGGKSMFEGVDHAVTVDDVIVFSRVPGLNSAEDIRWWAHEIHHVHQYTIWGVDQFAFNYLKHHGRVEGEAHQAASQVASYVQQLSPGAVITPQVSFASLQSFHAVPVQTPLGVSEVYVASAGNVQPTYPATDRCIIFGEDMIVRSDGEVFSLMRNEVIATRIPTPIPACAFELISKSTGNRVCAARPWGYVFAPNMPSVIGQCLPCTLTQCY